MPYDAITIDTNSFVHSGINLEAGLLGQLVQFKDGPTDLILSEIVTREVLKHLSQNTKKGRDAALSALSRLEQLQLVEPDQQPSITAVVASIGDSRGAARKRLARFITETGLQIISASLCSVEEVLDLYFKAGAPFEASGDKKSEFPDAIALLSLQKWAVDSHKKILAVSADKGWAAFAATSEQIDVESDLAKALEIVQAHADAAEEGVARLLALVESGDAPDVGSSIEEMLKTSLSGWDFHAEGSGSFFLEVDTTELRFGSFELLKVDEGYDITVVRLGQDTTVARIGATFIATAVADFSLSTWDSVDKEYVGMGSSSAESELEFEGAFLLTLQGDLSGSVEDVIVDEVEIVDAPNVVDFGEVEYDYGDYDYDYEAFLHEEVDSDSRADVEADASALAGGDEAF